MHLSIIVFYQLLIISSVCLSVAADSHFHEKRTPLLQDLVKNVTEAPGANASDLGFMSGLGSGGGSRGAPPTKEDGYQNTNSSLWPDSLDGNHTKDGDVATDWLNMLETILNTTIDQLPGLEEYADEIKEIVNEQLDDAVLDSQDGKNGTAKMSDLGPGDSLYAHKASNLSGEMETNQTDSVTKKVNMEGQYANGTECDTEGYVTLSATSLSTLSGFFSVCKELEVAISEDGSELNATLIQEVQGKISMTMISVIKITATPKVTECLVEPSETIYSSEIEANMTLIAEMIETLKADMDGTSYNASSLVGLGSNVTAETNVTQTIGAPNKLNRTKSHSPTKGNKNKCQSKNKNKNEHSHSYSLPEGEEYFDADGNRIYNVSSTDGTQYYDKEGNPIDVSSVTGSPIQRDPYTGEIISGNSSTGSSQYFDESGNPINISTTGSPMVRDPKTGEIIEAPETQYYDQYGNPVNRDSGDSDEDCEEEDTETKGYEGDTKKSKKVTLLQKVEAGYTAAKETTLGVRYSKPSEGRKGIRLGSSSGSSDNTNITTSSSVKVDISSFVSVNSVVINNFIQASTGESSGNSNYGKGGSSYPGKNDSGDSDYPGSSGGSEYPGSTGGSSNYPDSTGDSDYPGSTSNSGYPDGNSSTSNYPGKETDTKGSSYPNKDTGSSSYPGSNGSSEYPGGNTSTSNYPDKTDTKSSSYPDKDTYSNSYPSGNTSDSEYPGANTPTSSYPSSNTPSSSYPDKNTTTSSYPEKETPTSNYPDKETTTSNYPDKNTTNSSYPDKNTSTSSYPDEETPTSSYPDEETTTESSSYPNKETTEDSTYPTKSTKSTFSSSSESCVCTSDHKTNLRIRSLEDRLDSMHRMMVKRGLADL